MGVMRFLIPPTKSLQDWPEVYRAYVSGLDRTVWLTHVELDGRCLVCRQQNSESGKLHVAWPVEGFGKPVLTTSMLSQRKAPYLLPLELARGKIVQVRNQLACWDELKLQLPDEFRACYEAAHKIFARATACQEDIQQSSSLAQQALVDACRAAELLTVAHTDQQLRHQHQQYSQVPTSLGCREGDELPDSSAQRLFCEAFNSASVPVQWRTVEPNEGEYHWDNCDAQVDACLQNRLIIRGGPLFDLSPGGLPTWLWQWENDYLNLQSFVCNFVETAVSRYLGKIRIWELAARINSGGAMVLDEGQRLTLVAKTLEVAKHVDEEAQLVIRIDQPWGEYQARGQHQLSPIHFADALVRTGLGLSAIDLEIGIGYQPRGTPSRDLWEFSALIDRWSLLGLPLQITLAFPSSTGVDPRVTTDLEVDNDCWKQSWSEQAQADWIDQYLPLLISKPTVTAIFWAHFSDAKPHEFPHAGLIRPDGTPKPALQRMIEHRRRHLH